MKILLTCPQCGGKDWLEITDGQTLETCFQCKNCHTKAQPEEMTSCTERDTSIDVPKKENISTAVGKYFILEKYSPREDAWFFEACYNASNPHDLTAMVTSAYQLGRYKCCGEKEQCVRIVPSDTHISCFSPAGYPKQN